MLKKIIAVCIGGIGLIGGVASIISIPDTYKTFKMICIFISGILAIVGIIAWLIFYCGTILGPSTNKEYQQAGIVRIGKFSPSDELYDKFVNAKEIKFCAFSANMFLLHASDMIKEALSKNVIFKLLIIKQESEIVKWVELLENRKGLNSEIISSIDEVKHYNSSGFNGKIIMKYMPDTLYRMPIIIFDNECGVITHAIHPRRSKEAYKIEMIRNKKGLLEDIITYFDKCWDLSTPVKFE